MKLTQLVANTVKYDPSGPSQQIVWDRNVTGLGLRIYPSGKRSYVLSYRAGGRKRMMVLGSAGTLTLKQARDRAAKRLIDVIDHKDPLQEKQRGQLRRFGDFGQEYIQHIRAKGVKSWQEQERMIERFLTPWATWNIQSITRSDVARLHHQVGTDRPDRTGTPYLANRLLSQISHMFSVAIDISGFPETLPNPARRIQPFKEVSRDRRLEPKELPKLIKAIENEPNKIAANLFKFLLLTGLRRKEALTSRWEFVDRTRNVLTLPETKSGKPHDAPLNEPALALLDSLDRIPGNPYIFASGDGHMVSPYRVWRRIRKAAGMPDLRIHDLRRSVGSMMADAGISLHIIAGVLNHKKLTTTKIYAHLGNKTKANALEEHGQAILKVIKGGQR